MAVTEPSKIFRANRELCTGCRICELVCSMRRTGVLTPYRAAIRVSHNEEDGTFVPAMRFHERVAGVVVVDPSTASAAWPASTPARSVRSRWDPSTPCRSATCVRVIRSA